MTREELEAKRQKCAEANKAMREAIQEYKAGKPEGTEVTSEEWAEKATEKLRAAREEFTKLSNELLADEQQFTLDTELDQLEQWNSYFTEPMPHVPIRVAAGETGEQFQNVMEREASSLQRAMDSRVVPRTRANVNLQASFGNLGRVYRRDLGLNEEQKAAHRAFFAAYIRHGLQDGNTQEAMVKLREVAPEKFALLTSSGSDGGLWVPEDFQSEVIRDLPGFSIFRNIARIQRTGRDTFVYPTVQSPTAANAKKGYPSKYAGSWKAQRTTSGGGVALTTQDQPKVEQERIQIHRWEPDVIELSMEFLEDPEANVEQVLAEIISETKGIDETAAFTNGDGQGQPMGITAESLTAVNSGNASALKFNPGSNKGLLGLVGSIPPQYLQNATFMMNNLSYTTILGLETGSGTTLIFGQGPAVNLQASPMAQLLNFPVALNNFMPDVAANAYPVIFGDFRYYIIVDRTELRVMRLIERAAPNVAFLPVARLGGQVVKTTPFVRQKVAA